MSTPPDPTAGERPHDCDGWDSCPNPAHRVTTAAPDPTAGERDWVRRVLADPRFRVGPDLRREELVDVIAGRLARESAAATRARAEAWDEGWEYGGGVGNPPKSDNPYRAALAPDTAGESA